MTNRIVQRDVNTIKLPDNKEFQVMQRPDKRLTLSVYFQTGVEHAVLLERHAIELTKNLNQIYPNNHKEVEGSITFVFTAVDGQIVKFTKFVSGQMSIRISDIDDDVKPVIVSLNKLDAMFLRDILNNEYQIARQVVKGDDPIDKIIKPRRGQITTLKLVNKWGR